MSFAPLGHIPLSSSGMRRFDEIRDQPGFLPHAVDVFGGAQPVAELYPWQARPALIVVREAEVAVRVQDSTISPYLFDPSECDVAALRRAAQPGQHRATLVYIGEVSDAAGVRPVLALIAEETDYLLSATNAFWADTPSVGEDAALHSSGDETLSAWLSVRAFATLGFDELPENHSERAWGAVLSAASALKNWHRSAQFDPASGEPTTVHRSGWARMSASGRELFPRTDPAVITAVTAVFDGEDHLLLGHANAWEPRRFSTFAGFVEVGESLENTVEREVFEEANIVVESMSYRGSQPWPFPRSLMLGYRAVASNPQDARGDGDEIGEVRWFTRSELVQAKANGSVILPGRSSISRKLIEEWLQEGTDPATL
ncbi:NAD(+) diphosphatase [Rothia sp. ZJ1223]|uniref:NAD(+) diphosphatase n=1 Tax=Rothia sp. ZJ1223 TaxID=2811098 RepID=UPI00351C6172